MSKLKYWSKSIEESGVRIRIYERPASAALWYSVVQDGKKVRRSLQTGDRNLAQERARAIARELARAHLTGEDLRSPTLGHIFQLYRQEKLPLLSDARITFAETHLDLFAQAWGTDLEVSNLSPSHVARYVAGRRSGALSPNLNGREVTGVRDGTIDGDFKWLRSVFHFARRHKIGGRSALPANPLEDLTWPKEKNPHKPIASHERYIRTQEHTDAVDPAGRLRCILALARLTGRRESAICGLRVKDVLRDDKAVAKELAGAGMDERISGHMPHGAIRWSDEMDKEGFLFISPLSEQAREEVDRYLRKNPRVGDVPLFPGVLNGLKAIRRDVAARLLLRAERMAELPKLRRGVYHPYRRLWASERKALPSKDVAHAGGWKDIETMLGSYVQSDAATVLRVVENAG